METIYLLIKREITEFSLSWLTRHINIRHQSQSNSVTNDETLRNSDETGNSAFSENDSFSDFGKRLFLIAYFFKKMF